MRNLPLRFLALLLAFVLVAASCGDDDADSSDTTAAADNDAGTDGDGDGDEAPADDDSDDSGDGDGSDDDDGEMEDDADTGDALPNTLAEPLTINVTCAPAISALPFWVAREEGILAARNLTVECVQIGSGPETAAALVSGEAQFAGNIYNNIIPLVAGEFDVVAFSQVLDAQLFDIIVRADYELPEGASWDEVMAALDGGNVGVVARGAAAEDLARQLMAEAGLDPENQTYVAVGLDSVAPMVGGEIDWSITFDPNITAAELTGVAVRPFSIQQGEGPDGLNWPGLAMTGARSYVEERPDVACAYRSSLAEAATWIADPANRDRVIEIASAELPIDDPDIIGALVDNYSGLFNQTGEIDRDIIATIGQLSVDVGKAETVLTADDFVLEPDCE